MAQKYYLPCPSCGTKQVVDTGKLGLQFPCVCGHLLEVRTLRELRQLEPVAEPEPKQGWSLHQGVLFLGLVLIAVGTVGALLSAASLWPAPTDTKNLERRIDQWADNLSLSQSFQEWENLENRGIEDPLYAEESAVTTFVNLQEEQYSRLLAWGGLCISTAVLGVGLTLWSLLWPNQAKKPTASQKSSSSAETTGEPPQSPNNPEPATSGSGS